MNQELDDIGLEGLGLITLLGALVVGVGGVYALKKAGVTGSKVWLGVAAVPVVWFVGKSIGDANRERRETYVSSRQTTVAPTLAPQPAPIARQLNDFELLDQLAGWGT